MKHHFIAFEHDPTTQKKRSDIAQNLLSLLNIRPATKASKPVEPITTFEHISSDQIVLRLRSSRLNVLGGQTKEENLRIALDILETQADAGRDAAFEALCNTIQRRTQEQQQSQ